MSHLTPLPTTELGKVKFLLKLVKENMGFVPNSLKTLARTPAILGSFVMLTGLTIGDPKKASPMTMVKLLFKNARWASGFMKKEDRVPLYLRNLVAHITSKAAGCIYCQAHTIGEALHNGATEEQLNAIWEFESSPVFDDKERAALRFALAAGSVPNAVTQDHFREMKRHFSDDQIVELGAVVSVFGFLNRWNDTFATTLEAEPLATAEKYLSKNGWTAGKHG